MSTTQAYIIQAERPFVVDPHSIMRNGGAQVTWADWGAGYQDTEGNKVLPAGTICAITSDELVPPAAGGADAAVILATPAQENSGSDSLTGYGVIVGGVIYKNLLPDSAHGDFAAMITALEATGPGFRFETYADSRDA